MSQQYKLNKEKRLVFIFCSPAKPEDGEPSQKRKQSNQWNYNNESNNWQYERIHTGIKYQKIPRKYNPRIGLGINQDILDIDCVENQIEKIENWYNLQRILIKLNEDLKGLNSEEILNYLIHKTSGKVLNYLNALSEEEKELIIEGPTGLEVIDALFKKLAIEFIGKDLQNITSFKRFEEMAYWHLLNLRICNMCYLDNYICEFEEKYYKLSKEKNERSYKFLL